MAGPKTKFTEDYANDSGARSNIRIIENNAMKLILKGKLKKKETYVASSKSRAISQKMSVGDFASLQSLKMPQLNDLQTKIKKPVGTNVFNKIVKRTMMTALDSTMHLSSKELLN